MSEGPYKCIGGYFFTSDRTARITDAEVVALLNKQHAQIERLREAMQTAFNLAQAAPELNMNNYDHDQVGELNSKMVELWGHLRAVLEETK